MQMNYSNLLNASIDFDIIVFFSTSICVWKPRLFFMIGVIAVFHVSQLVVHITEQLVKLAVVGQAWWRLNDLLHGLRHAGLLFKDQEPLVARGETYLVRVLHSEPPRDLIEFLA